MTNYTQLAYASADQLVFGKAMKPVKTKRGMAIGGGIVYPELNFTLPTMMVEAATMPEVERHYREIITGALARAAHLDCQGLVIEFETLPPMTENPDWGMAVVKILLDGMEEAHAKTGIKSVLRMTPNDTREMERPPRMRSGPLYDCMIELFERSAAAGAELLSIESVGGKEVHDDALMAGDLEGVLFGLGVLGVRDMGFLWTKIKQIADKHGVYAAGDTACGFANTAMVLAEQGMIPKVFSAVVRAISAVRSLVAYECGAVGPGKDCGYENIIVKAITGSPMAMEGKTAACAHLSQVGNVAGAACDTWSNESVQNIKLLGGMAPTCYVEQLIYDCRLFNQATADGHDSALQLQKWLVQSDVNLDPQALVLSPESAVRIGGAIVGAENHYLASRDAGLEAIAIIKEANAAGKLAVSERELPWLDMMADTLQGLPTTESEFIQRMMGLVDTDRFILAEYGLA